MDLDVPFEDDHLLVVNKPRGLATHPASSLKEPSLVNALIGRGTTLSGGEGFRPGIVHRLDKDTTGLMVVAKTDEIHRKLQQLISDRQLLRVYVFRCHGDIGSNPFRVEAPILRDPKYRLRMTIDPKGKAAATQFYPIELSGPFSTGLAKLETGRTHQIRVHLSSVKRPIAGDSLYGSPLRNSPMCLHSCYLSFRHPVSDELIEVFSSAPPVVAVDETLLLERLEPLKAL
jgi:23S rRNA pseudouridine1911/1915/1917 synthase